MTKSDFEMLANAIYDQRFLERNNPEGVATLDRMARRLAVRLSDESPRFNQNAFLKACGLDDSKETT